MIIPINVPAHTNRPDGIFPPQLARLGTEEVILIELQGSFHVDGDQSGQLAARLKLDNESKPTLLIGHNLLEGKIVNFSKPLAVLYKKSSNDDSMQVDRNPQAGEQETEQTAAYDMLAVVKRKVLFSKRPMPMVNVASSISTDVSAKSVS